MTEQTKTIKKKRIFSKLGFEKEEAVQLVTGLSQLLASYNVHYQKLRNFHWNVKGPEFFDIHEKFELQYKQAQQVIDEIAERVRVFGQRPPSTLKEFLEFSEIKEPAADLSAKAMVKEILQDYRTLMDQIFDVEELALELGDSGTEQMMKNYVKGLEKYHWMMSAFSSNE